MMLRHRQGLSDCGTVNDVFYVGEQKNLKNFSLWLPHTLFQAFNQKNIWKKQMDFETRELNVKN